MRKFTFLAVMFCLFGFGNIANAQIVNIPDANFKGNLVSNTSINTNGDNEIQTSEASVFSGTINVNDKHISNMTGIEAFTSLEYLICSYNQLTSLNLSANTALTDLECYNNQLTSLNLPASTAFTTLECDGNQLTSLNLSVCSALTFLNCNYNQLTSLNLSANTSLNALWCSNNQLTNLNISNCTALKTLWCSDNQLTSLDLSPNTALTYLFCNTNQLTSLNLTSNTSLSTLVCSFNQLISLELSSYSAYDTLDCSYNQLTSLNINNGNNYNFIWFSATNNPSLSCIQVDDSTFMNNNWEGAKDSTAYYSENCVITIPSAPTNLTLSSQKNILAKMILSWTDNSNNEDGFRIYISTDNTTFSEIGTTAANVNSYIDSTGAASTLYYYRVTAYNSAGSSTFSNTTSGTTTGINEISENNEMSLYPNPTTGRLAVSLTSGNIGTIEIYNLIGEKVYEKNFNQQKPAEIDISNSPCGIYFLKISNGTKVYTSKIVVQ